MAAYTMDSHHVRRYVTKDGYVKNEGDVEVGGFSPYPIDYGAIVPKRSECENLLVPVCLSATHIAFGSIRMEPVFFALGQAAGTAASLAVEGGDVAVQDVPYARLAARLSADGQVVGDTTYAWPAAWTDKSQVSAEIATRFGDWKAAFAPGVAEFDGAAESAFLLGVAPTATTQTLSAASIAVEGNAVKVTGRPALDKANGVVYVLYGPTPATEAGCKAVDVGEDGEGVIQLQGSPPAEFYRIGVGYTIPE